jgi:hypothetical protein
MIKVIKSKHNYKEGEIISLLSWKEKKAVQDGWAIFVAIKDIKLQTK